MMRKEIKRSEEKNNTEVDKNLLSKLSKLIIDQAKLPFPNLRGYSYIPLNDIIMLKCDDMYTTFYLTDKRQLVATKNIGHYEEILSQYNFLRPHASYLVNKTHIIDYIKGKGGHVIATLNLRAPVSNSKKKKFLEELNAM